MSECALIDGELASTHLLLNVDGAAFKLNTLGWPLNPASLCRCFQSNIFCDAHVIELSQKRMLQTGLKKNAAQNANLRVNSKTYDRGHVVGCAAPKTSVVQLESKKLKCNTAAGVKCSKDQDDFSLAMNRFCNSCSYGKEHKNLRRRMHVEHLDGKNDRTRQFGQALLKVANAPW